MKKINAVVFDLTGGAMEWLNNYGNEDHLEINEIITLDDDSPIPIWDINMYDNWDILLVFENGVGDYVNTLLDKIGISRDVVIYPLDTEYSMYEKADIALYIFNKNVRKMLEYDSRRRNGEKYVMVSAENNTYINSATDNVILPKMFASNKNWACDDMELFHRLSEEYFTFNDKQDIFCDIGANIGTTCIYFKKKYERDIKILAFEPSSENYKLLRINALLNDIDVSEHLFINAGVSDHTEDAVISFDPVNPGGSSLVNDNSDIKENVRLFSFDDFLMTNSIDPERLRYLWIDVEGYEARFLAGACKTLSTINVPVFMEFVPAFYMDRDGEFDRLIKEIEKHFKYFIRVDKIEDGKQLIEKLWEEQNNKTMGWDLFLLKE